MCRLFTRCVSTIFFVSTVRYGHTLSSSWPSSPDGDGWEESTTGLLGARRVSDVLWDKTYMSSKITVRLVKKSWKPKGLTNDKSMKEFPGTVEEAYKILRANADYEYIERPLSRAGELFTAKVDGFEPEFDNNLDSIIIIHPLFSNADDGYFTKPVVTAFGMRNIHRYNNLFLYHMPKLNINMFFTIIREIIGYKTRYEVMAEVLCSFILEGIGKQHWQPKNINFIGYSYSANLAGYMARYVRFAAGTGINSIMCLDPYSAQYNKNLIHVHKDDADVVHILHTSSYVQGTRERIGTADFVFNDGFIQPECSGLKNIIDKILRLSSAFEPFFCSHLRVVPRFLYVILFPSKFQARQCDTWPRFKNCFCEEKDKSIVSYPIVARGAGGTYYLRTTDTKPYGLGDEGSHCSAKAREKLDSLKERINNKMQPLN